MNPIKEWGFMTCIYLGVSILSIIYLYTIPDDLLDTNIFTLLFVSLFAGTYFYDRHNAKSVDTSERRTES